MAASNNDGLCPDWIYSDSSNVHVAKDKAWFTSYHSFQSQLSSIYAIGAPIPVLGIGTIKLTVKALPGSFTIYGTSVIELHNVLHVPSYFCNVLGRPLANVYEVGLGGSVHEGGPPSRGGLFLSGRQVAHFQSGPISFFSLAVLPPKGKGFGASPFSNGASWVVSCHWPLEERVRWQAIRNQTKREWKPPRYEPPYTLEELEHVNERWGSEFRFLAQYRLKLPEEKDRSEGRRIVRELMRGKDPAKEEEKETEVEGKLKDYLKPDGGTSARHARDPSAPRVPFL
ncbi:hypothetical protein BU25DRAFT_42080 [Macroventuria anomochaeta]|uniref:Uncharacterized protein n=1 Tax=Macroventuria anomochaeta TaxID=301207 RepID=A0ACB6S240_9PLEO|nr:uncharacterized protein BU25DRAFT_42080 [Macroventuria anomochaeta]KAF2628216.1 hypothetical protein BU25DRAFT_42080 [Macroventuria anomochaeta]